MGGTECEPERSEALGALGVLLRRQADVQVDEKVLDMAVLLAAF